MGLGVREIRVYSDRDLGPCAWLGGCGGFSDQGEPAAHQYRQRGEAGPWRLKAADFHASFCYCHPTLCNFHRFKDGLVQKSVNRSVLGSGGRTLLLTGMTVGLRDG